ncbi:hemagglutinin/amebocyte aggregation factor-like [Saccostrea echinata]|uniref:hemagglutinin/amebocyte aggregation factor-like n=1 Tax=Saccostrea echinata TaxID=191078 RepID=UPI002A8384F5|nr:hemagglutinin/amebocyte aggregation factor-like [Saccostrea echinata]
MAENVTYTFDSVDSGQMLCVIQIADQKGIMEIILFAVYFVLLSNEVFCLKNKWDGALNFHCPSSAEFIDAVVSFHHNYYEDRRYEFHCGRALKRRNKVNCHWTGYVNDFDHAVHFQCPGSGYINGMASYHHNYYEDRRHRFRCCGPRSSNYHFQQCRWTGWLNNYDQPVIYFVPRGYVLRGVNSVHHNYYE